MANPQDLRFINDVVAASLDEQRPVLVDLTFRSNALFCTLYEKDKVFIAGGEEIRVPFIYGKLDGGSYKGLGNFPVQTKENMTDLRFEWKQNFAAFTLPEIDVFKNSSPHKIFDLVAAKSESCRLTLADNIGTQLFSDGSNDADVTGLRLALSDTGTYGKIPRGADPQGSAIRGNFITTGGPITPAMVNTLMGRASRGGATKPDLLITTQTLWDALWARLQPQQQFPTTSTYDYLARAGFKYIEINGSAIVVDSHCPDGFMFGLNTDYVEFYIGQGKDFYMRGPFPLIQQDGFTAQLILYSELAVQAPDLCFMANNLTE